MSSQSNYFLYRCGSCQRIAPIFEEMASKFKNALFLKVDIQNCPNYAKAMGIIVTPTFIFFRNKVRYFTFVFK